MAQRRFHYEQAFEHYLRANRVPYVAVDEARKALLPLKGNHPAPPMLHEVECELKNASRNSAPPSAIKSFDFVVYAPQRNLLVDVKGRMYGRPPGGCAVRKIESRRRFESWVTDEDVDGLTRWQELFGSGFQATFVFSYCLRQQPPDALFEEVYTFGGRWYALREIPLDAYRREMARRSASWGTVHIPAEAFTRISRPFSVRGEHSAEPSPLAGRTLAG